ncbi:hypothetical protein SteCoe_27134 [Stentor coeruleus]|uniref:Uncharacterized protein n=1 Tax=Stentor coeruleus TaxID=5963 RepID=A0A1R2BB93_9CILI|nr:hypothetical protein SteCoe_27134 [Stentor coeruleus]
MLNLKSHENQSKSHRNSIFDGLNWDKILSSPQNPNPQNPCPKLQSSKKSSGALIKNKAESVPRKSIVSPKDLTKMRLAFSPEINPKNSLGRTLEIPLRTFRETFKTTNATNDLSSETHIECQSASLITAKTSLEQIRAEAKQCFANSKSIIQSSKKKTKSPTSSETKKNLSTRQMDINKEIIDELVFSVQILNRRLSCNEKAADLQEGCNNELRCEVDDLKVKISKHKILMQDSPTVVDCLSGCMVI